MSTVTPGLRNTAAWESPTGPYKAYTFAGPSAIAPATLLALGFFWTGLHSPNQRNLAGRLTAIGLYPAPGTHLWPITEPPLLRAGGPPSATLRGR
jgi:hypothetical protein